ncbi:5188_t:CDS:2 [Funneliformis caledonium]|uniref:5188_t:CDS:1 n=1 Tax=Funneliformis caledonium TaxID=1117310 RepID=A0A9N9HYG5_9GLOM|nr:5188_t:CDS:2 [Funneliformis caledonium]
MNNKQFPTQNELNNSEEADDDIFGLEMDMKEWGDDDDSSWEDETDLEKEKETQLKFMKAGLGW